MRNHVVVVAVSLGLAAPALAGPFGVRLNFAGDPSTSVAISWNSDDAADNEVHWGTSPDALSNTTLVGPSDQHAMDAPLGTSFSAHLTGLTPSTTYFYEVGHGASLYPTTAYSFATLSNDPCAPVHFAAIGDNRTDALFGSAGVSPKYAGILGDAAATTPSFFVNTGDMVRDGTSATQWNDLITTSEPTWSQIPSLTTQGNHDAGSVDGDGAPYNELFELPRNPATSTEDFYSIDVGPIHFATINANHTTDTELQTEAQWLDADLAATSQPWKIVFFHKGIYSRGNHHTGEEKDADGNDGVLNATYVPIFDAHHVDLVINGHSHDYERFAPSRGVDAAFGGTGRTLPAGDASALDPAAPLPDGATATTYVVTGGGGASTTDVPLLDFNCPDGSCTFCGIVSNRCDQTVFDEDQAASVAFQGAQHFMSFTVEGGTLTAEAIETNGDGTGPTGTIDTFTIHKASSSCAQSGEGEGGVGEGEGGVVGEGEGGVVGEGEGASGGEGEGASAGEGEGEGAGVEPEAPRGCSCDAVQASAPLGVAAVVLFTFGVARRRRSR